MKTATTIPIAARRLATSRLPLAHSYAEFPGGHEIRPAELQAAMQWLETLCVTGLEMLSNQ